MQGRRRRNDEVARVRALWAERNAPGQPLPLPASLVIATSPSRCHEYLLTDDASLQADEARNLNRRLADRCASDRGATDPARVLRLAGSWHVKGAPFQVHITASTGQRYTADALRAALPEPPVVEMTQMTPASSASCPSLVGTGIHDPGRYLQVVTACLVAELGAAAEGCRNTTLNRLAFRLALLGLDVDAIYERLGPAALTLGLSGPETDATIRSAMRTARRIA